MMATKQKLSLLLLMVATNARSTTETLYLLTCSQSQRRLSRQVGSELVLKRRRAEGSEDMGAAPKGGY